MTSTTSTATAAAGATTKNTAATATTTSAVTGAVTSTLLSPANQHFVEELSVAANAYSSAHGIQVESRMMASAGAAAASNEDGGTTTTTTTTTLYKCAPVSLLPNAYPKPAFEDAVSLATSFNLLVDRVSRDAMFLLSTLGGGVATADPFTARLLQLYQTIYVNEATKVMAAITADRLGIHRSDYMLHQTTQTTDDNEKTSNKPLQYTIKQVELNTIAASFAGLSSRVAEMHRYLTDRYDSSLLREYFTVNQNAVGGRINDGTSDECSVPVNPTLVKLPFAMSLVVERYKQRFFGIGHNDDNNKKDDMDNNLAVLFVVQEGETNTVDQRLLEFHLFQNHGLRVVRASLATIAKHAILSTTDSRLTLFGKEIALVYFRAGYAPTDYPSTDDSEWSARTTLERCRAAKSPSLGYHLAGTKKIQQALARPGVLERYFSSPNDVELVTKLRSAFAGLYSLDVNDMTAEDYRAVRHVLDDPIASDRYVLKPQREGGGYNFYGPDLLAKIKANVTVDSSNEDDAKSLTLHESLGEYILMERLFPPQQTAILLRNGQVEGIGDSISELGCYGTIITDGTDGTVIANEYAGYLLRTKFSNVNEGGVASGFATLSSPYLC